MAEFTDRITISFGAGADLIGGEIIIASEAKQDFSIDLGVVTNQQREIGFDDDNLELLFIIADQNMTIYVNAASSGSPTDTISLTAGEAWEWHRSSGQPYPFTGTGGDKAVTSMFLTTTVATHLDIRCRLSGA